MTDNIFDRLAELLSSPGPVNWGIAAELGTSVAGESIAVDATATGHWSDYVDTARRFLPAEAGVDPADVRVVDRRTWTAENVQAFAYVAEPLAAKLTDMPGLPIPGMFSIMVGMQVGSMTGSLSQRLLGNFDAILPPLSPGKLYFVVPNIGDFTRDHELDPSQVDLWLAIHELVHASLLSRPAVTDTLKRLVGDYVGGLELNLDGLPLQGLESGFDPESLAQTLQDPNFLSGMFTGPHQQADLAEIQAFLALLEGYTDFLLDQLEPNLIPQLPQLREAVDRRKAAPSQGEQFLQRLLGIELQRPLYRAGPAFFTEISTRWGPESVSTVWETAESVPRASELEDPVAWAARVLLP